MKVVYSPIQAKHNPKTQVHNGKVESYPEQPKRAEVIIQSLKLDGRFQFVEPVSVKGENLLTIHSKEYVGYIKSHSEDTKRGDVFYPSNFITDTYAPIAQGTYSSALAAVSSAITGAELIIKGEKQVYSLCRPPGHHAGCNHSGGYCYFNNAALAADTLANYDKVAILDIDYHHGNGTQDVFYERHDVLYVSIHADPAQNYPYLSGFEDETGKHAGVGFTKNYPLPENANESKYVKTLTRALDDIKAFQPAYLVVSLGFDTHKEDPVGGLGLSTDSYAKIGEQIRALDLPTLIIQEGGYNTSVLGEACLKFLEQLLD